MVVNLLMWVYERFFWYLEFLCVFGFIIRERLVYVLRVGVGGRVYVVNKDGNLGKVL